MFRHPNYYKNLRKLARNSELHVRPQGSEACDTDQAISPTRATAPSRRATGPGQSLTRDSNADGGEGSSSKRQAIDETVPHCDIEEAASNKPQAPSSSKKRPQASSPKQQASSDKPQAASSVILEP